MAQYFHVLSQPEKPTPEEIRQFYPNIVENQTQTIQYVLKPDEPAFQSQQILVSSSDRLMVVDGQSQQVIIDQTQVAYQGQQYVFQDAKVEFQEGQQVQQPIYYMDESANHRPEQAQAEQPVQQQQQPIVLNHQLPGSPSVRPQLNSGPGQKVVNIQRQSQISSSIRQERPVLQIQHNHGQVPVHVRPPPVQMQCQRSPHVPQPKIAPSAAAAQNRTVAAQNRARRPIDGGPSGLHSTQQPININTDEITESDNHEAIALDNGSIVSLAQYKQMVQEKKQQQQQQQQSLASQMPAIQERLEAPPIVNPTNQGAKRKSNSGTPRPARSATRPIAANRGGNVQYGVVQENQNQGAQSRFPIQQRKITNQQPRRMIANALPPHRFMQPQQTQMIMQRHVPPQVPVQAPSIPPPPPPPIQQTVQPQYIIHPPSQHHHQQRQQQSLPHFVPSNQIQQLIDNTPVSEDYIDSIRMLVLLSNGEQRLITFTLPKEQCSIQEILEQVGVVIVPETKIECTETNTNGINYIVTVGLHHQYGKSDSGSDESMETDESKPSLPETPPKAPTPEPPKEVPKVIPGWLALCGHCGYLSEDFNKCLRCKRKLPEDVKSVSAADQPGLKKLDGSKVDKKQLPSSSSSSAAANKTNGKLCSVTVRSRRKEKPKLVDAEPIILTLSSDEEEDETGKTRASPLKLESHITLSEVKKEPTINDIQQSDCELSMQGVKGGGKEDNAPNVETFIFCRTVRIGSYRFVPPDDIVVNNTSLIIRVPLPKESKETKTITIERKHIVKVLVNFLKQLPVIFYYVMPTVGHSIRNQLGMVQGAEPYFDPLSKEEAYKRITILPEILADETKIVFKQVYGKPCSIMDELTAKEANNILLKTCPKEVTRAINAPLSFSEVKTLLIYPPGKGGLSINTEDYLCLAQDQFLNDVIIDFHLRYTVLNLAEEQQEKVHVFSTFFYKRLTTKPLKASRRTHPSELDAALTPAQKRHARVKTWTKSVNLFEKDFIIVPINESSHWFLAIICFPGLDGPYTFDGKSVKLEPKTKKKKTLSTTIGNVTITQVKLEKEDTITCDDGDASDKDEAEGDDSEMDSEDDFEESSKNNNSPIKQPCILIFDSLAGASRSRVVATLRDYLTCEYAAKMNAERSFSKDLIKCACPKIPQQTNFTDCGLYLLQYVESFFTDPIKNYRMPISELKTWFEEITVTRKREDISKLIKELMIKYDKDPDMLPDIQFPTLNGKLLPRPEDDDEDEDEEDEEEEMEEEDESFDDLANQAMHESEEFEEEEAADQEREPPEGGEAETRAVFKTEDAESPAAKPSGGDDCERTVTLVRPELGEVKKQSSRDTLSYLKAKRIIRHKNPDCTETKKFKQSTSDDF